MTVKFHNNVEDRLLKFAVIIAKYQGKYVFCQHRARATWEVPGGHREPGESIDDTARRELMEETGALTFSLCPICAYSVIPKGDFQGEESFGMLYSSEISALAPELHSEIGKIQVTSELPQNWTYPKIQPRLLTEAKKRGFLQDI